jgi:hypothetical protein
MSWEKQHDLQRFGGVEHFVVLWYGNVPFFKLSSLKNFSLNQKSTSHYFPSYKFQLVPEVKNLSPDIQYSIKF